MKTKVFSVWDTKAECYGTPFFMPNRNMALRAFHDLAKDDKTTIFKHPSDYALFEIGEYEDNTGELIYQKPINLGMPPAGVPEVIDLGKLKEVTNNLLKTEVK